MKYILSLFLTIICLGVYAHDNVDKYGMTPLANAIISHKIDTAVILFEESPESLLVQDKKDGYSALHYLAILDGDKSLKVLQVIPDTLLEKALPIKDRYGRTALDIAAKFNRYPMIKQIYERPLSKIIPQSQKDSHLLYAADKGNPEIVLILLKNGANVNVRNEKQQTPLMLAAPFKKGGAFKEIMSGKPNLNLADSWGLTALHYASDIGAMPHVEILIKAGANVDPVDKRGRTPLFYALEGTYEKVVPYLVFYKASVHHKDNEGMTPLMIAAKKRFAEAVVFLVEEGAKIDEQDHKGYTAAMWGTDQMDYVVVEYLLDMGTDSMLKNKAGETLLDVAKREKNEDVILLLKDNKKLTLEEKE